MTASEIDTPRLVSADELAPLMRVKPARLLEQARLGTIPSYRVGRQVRFDLSEVLAATRNATPRQRRRRVGVEQLPASPREAEAAAYDALLGLGGPRGD